MDNVKINEFGEIIRDKKNNGPEIPNFVLERQKEVEEEQIREQMNFERKEREERRANRKKAKNIKIAKRLAIILASGAAIGVITGGIIYNTRPIHILEDEFRDHNGLGEIDGYIVDPSLPHGSGNNFCDLIDSEHMKEFSINHTDQELLEEYAHEHGLEDELNALYEEHKDVLSKDKTR